MACTIQNYFIHLHSEPQNKTCLVENGKYFFHILVLTLHCSFDHSSRGFFLVSEFIDKKICFINFQKLIFLKKKCWEGNSVHFSRWRVNASFIRNKIKKVNKKMLKNFVLYSCCKNAYFSFFANVIKQMWDRIENLEFNFNLNFEQLK